MEELKGWGGGRSYRELYHFFKSIQVQYEHESWCDSPTFSHSVNLSLLKSLRYYNTGVLPLYELCAVLDGVQLEPRQRNEKHLKRLKYLLTYQASLVNDIFSVRKEIDIGEANNLVLAYCCGEQPESSTTTTMDFSQSLKKVLRRHDRVGAEAKQLYDYLQASYSKDSNIIKYVEIMVSQVEGNVMFHMHNPGRYGVFKWSVQAAAI